MISVISLSIFFQIFVGISIYICCLIIAVQFKLVLIFIIVSSIKIYQQGIPWYNRFAPKKNINSNNLAAYYHRNRTRLVFEFTLKNLDACTAPRAAQNSRNSQNLKLEKCLKNHQTNKL